MKTLQQCIKLQQALSTDFITLQTDVVIMAYAASNLCMVG